MTTKSNGLGPYNGYSGKERMAKFKAMKSQMGSGTLASPLGPCELCGDPSCDVEYHDEDYSEPYLWSAPAAYKVCRTCHVSKLHGRFRYQHLWQAFLAHVRRGGHARDLKDPGVSKEVKQYGASVKAGNVPLTLVSIRPYAAVPGTEWFAALSTDPETLVAETSRPRP